MTGYPHPVLIGGKADGAGNWEWEDGSSFDLTFMQARPDTLSAPFSCPLSCCSLLSSLFLSPLLYSPRLSSPLCRHSLPTQAQSFCRDPSRFSRRLKSVRERAFTAPGAPQGKALYQPRMQWKHTAKAVSGHVTVSGHVRRGPATCRTAPRTRSRALPRPSSSSSVSQHRNSIIICLPLLCPPPPPSSSSPCPARPPSPLLSSDPLLACPLYLDFV